MVSVTCQPPAFVRSFLSHYGGGRSRNDSNNTTRSSFVYNGKTSVPKTITNVVVKEGVQEIPKNAFYDYHKLLYIRIPDSVQMIGVHGFGHCTSLLSIELPSSVQEIDQYTFHGCSSLQSIHLPPQVTHIGTAAFMRCSSLQSITIPSSISKIEDYTFFHCKSLTSISLPSSVTEISVRAFDGCSSLQTIHQPPPSILHHDNDGGSILDSSSSSKLSFVIKIGKKAFHDCTSLESIHLPSCMQCIGSEAFAGCTSLRSITLPSSIGNIHTCQALAKQVFTNCHSVETVRIATTSSSTTTTTPQQHTTTSSIHKEAVALLKSILFQNPNVTQLPCTTTTTTSESCLSLHLILMYGLFSELIEFIEGIIQTAPSNLTTCDPTFDMYPFQLAACTPKSNNRIEKLASSFKQPNQQLDIIYILLHEAPWVIHNLTSNLNTNK